MSGAGTSLSAAPALWPHKKATDNRSARLPEAPRRPVPPVTRLVPAGPSWPLRRRQGEGDRGKAGHRLHTGVLRDGSPAYLTGASAARSTGGSDSNASPRIKRPSQKNLFGDWNSRRVVAPHCSRFFKVPVCRRRRPGRVPRRASQVQGFVILGSTRRQCRSYLHSYISWMRMESA